MSHPLDTDALYHCQCGEWHYKTESAYPPCRRCPRCDHGLDNHNEYGCFVKEGRNGCDDAYCMCIYVPPAIKDQQREARRAEALKQPCKTHPRYTIVHPPRSACETCWRLWVRVNPKPLK